MGRGTAVCTAFGRGTEVQPLPTPPAALWGPGRFGNVGGTSQKIWDGSVLTKERGWDTKHRITRANIRAHEEA